MKKVLLLAVAGVFVLASCAKDRTCECTENGVTEKSGTYKKVSKSFMQTEAECYSYEYTEDNKTYKRECEIK